MLNLYSTIFQHGLPDDSSKCSFWMWKLKAFFLYSVAISLNVTTPVTLVTSCWIFMLVPLPRNAFLFWLLKFSNGGAQEAWKRALHLVCFLHRIVDWPECCSVHCSAWYSCLESKCRCNDGVGAFFLLVLTKPECVSLGVAQAPSCTCMECL